MRSELNNTPDLRSRDMHQTIKHEARNPSLSLCSSTQTTTFSVRAVSRPLTGNS